MKPEGCDEAAGCPLTKKCGGCQFTKVPYTEQLKHKQMHMRKLLGRFGKVEPIIGMEQPLYYRHKVHAVLGRGRKGEIISGTYEARSHKIVPVEHCLIEDEKAQAVIATVRRLIKEFKLYIYDEDLGTGLMRHVLVRRGYATGEILVVLVTGTVVFPGKNNFVKALVKEHPEITTIVQNINDRRTSVVLGEREQVLYGPGFIRDELCGFTFRISASSFYQVNPAQTEKLYNTAIEMAGLTGKETVIDAYCGTGTIGIAASRKAGRVIGVEVNKAAVRDARLNLKDNAVKNMTVKQDDAGRFMLEMAARGEKADVVLMDPPRTGSDKNFLSAVTKMGPDRIVYISCGPDTLARDLGILTKSGYRVMRMQPVDLFPQTEHIENVVLLSNKKSHR
ncbi:MAG: 23S rRNA (uracil(1939)-C(5))-methyltransferase RlmD [Lachnospiraceae bacterium]|nr:23S rRNA (uracil(1939)-C(5))-methyltransferase RlmD [Lachnospiraceae bacterium]